VKVQRKVPQQVREKRQVQVPLNPHVEVPVKIPLTNFDTSERQKRDKNVQFRLEGSYGPDPPTRSEAERRGTTMPASASTVEKVSAPEGHEGEDGGVNSSSDAVVRVHC
jgi:hypothetical protein